MLSAIARMRAPKPVVLSMDVQAELARTQPQREQSRFEVLVRHLFDRFLNNELMASDGESSRAAQMGITAAIPGLLVSLYLFAPYHQPGHPRLFWPQVCDHYFFVMYAMIALGVVTVYEWDLLFPDLLDVFVLTMLPIPERRLFFARVLAVAIFLALALVGTNFLGVIFLPMVADQPSLSVHLFAHATAVAMGGCFTAGTFLALQGVLLNLLGERTFRRITPLLQGGSITVLLTVLFLSPLLLHYLEALLNSGNRAVLWFPPFWFLGIYERLLHGQAAPQVFQSLARTGLWATLLTSALVVVTYPLAYRRRVRQLIEGTGTMDMRSWISRPLHALLHATILRIPAQRAIFHFVSQTVLRTQRHRVLLAMYGGLGIAFAAAEMIVLHINGSHVQIGFLPQGIRAALPVLVFWTVAGLRTALAAPVDRRGAWVFHVVQGRPTLDNLQGAKLWVVLWAFAVGLTTAAALRVVSPDTLRTPLAGIVQIIVAIGLGLLLTDKLFLKTVAVPFTALHRTSITDMPWAFVRYFVVFPILILTLLDLEPWMEANPMHLLRIVLFVSLAHGWWSWSYARRVNEMRSGSDFEDEEQIFQGLGLRD